MLMKFSTNTKVKTRILSHTCTSSATNGSSPWKIRCRTRLFKMRRNVANACAQQDDPIILRRLILV